MRIFAALCTLLLSGSAYSSELVHQCNMSDGSVYALFDDGTDVGTLKPVFTLGKYRKVGRDGFEQIELVKFCSGTRYQRAYSAETDVVCPDGKIFTYRFEEASGCGTGSVGEGCAYPQVNDLRLKIGNKILTGSC